ncbi:unnamed protein product [Larinioides sclopetarius]
MTALKLLMSCLFIFTLNTTISAGVDTSSPPRHISEFSDPMSGFNPFIDLEEGSVNDSRPSIEKELIENRRTNLLSAISTTESGRKIPDFINEYEQSKIPNLEVYDSFRKAVTTMKKMSAKESEQEKTPNERHLRVHDSIKNKESIINKLKSEESQKIRLVTVNNESETTENIITRINDITENGNDELEKLNYFRNCKKSGIPNYRTLRNRKMKKQYKSSDFEIYFPTTVDSNVYTIYAIVCTIVTILIILYVALSLKYHCF